jgi:Tol biopolymer transport system component
MRIDILMRFSRLLALVFIPAASAGLCCAQTHRHRPNPTFQIVFDENPEFSVGRNLNIGSDICVMDQYGEHIKRLTSDHRSHNPAWSPNGQQLLFLKNAPVPKHKGWYESPEEIYSLLTARSIFRMNRNPPRSDAQEIASVGPDAQDVVWLPGRPLFAVRFSDRRNLTIFIGPLDTSTQTFAAVDKFGDLVAAPKPTGWRWAWLTEFFPAGSNFLPAFYGSWKNPMEMSPEKFARANPFAPDRSSFARMMNIDGSASSLPDRPYDIAWSSDGQQVAFSKFSDNGNSQLYVAAVWNGQARATLIAGGPGQETLNPHSPAWSADGGRVAFLGDWKNSSQLFTISRDGSSLLQFSRDSTISCAHPSWSPDGRWIVAGCGQKEGSAEPFGDLYNSSGQMTYIYSTQSRYIKRQKN